MDGRTHVGDQRRLRALFWLKWPLRLTSVDRAGQAPPIIGRQIWHSMCKLCTSDPAFPLTHTSTIGIGLQTAGVLLWAIPCKEP